MALFLRFLTTIVCTICVSRKGAIHKCHHPKRARECVAKIQNFRIIFENIIDKGMERASKNLEHWVMLFMEGHY